MKFRLFRNVHWSDKLVDVLVVVLGITIAFWLNNWRENQKNRASEHQYLSALETDLGKDTVELLKIIESMDTVFFGIDRMYTLADKLEYADSVTHYLFLLDEDKIRFFPEDYTYKSLQQSGNIRLIQNDSLLLVLSHLYDKYAEINVWNEFAYEWQFRNYLPYLNNYDKRRGRLINPEIYVNPLFDAFLLRYRYNLIARKELVEGALEKHRTLQKLIQKEIQK